MWILELQIVLLLEILSYSALHGLAIFKLQGKPVEKRAKKKKKKKSKKVSFIRFSMLNAPHTPLQT